MGSRAYVASGPALKTAFYKIGQSRCGLCPVKNPHRIVAERLVPCLQSASQHQQQLQKQEEAAEVAASRSALQDAARRLLLNKP